MELNLEICPRCGSGHEDGKGYLKEADRCYRCGHSGTIHDSLHFLAMSFIRESKHIEGIVPPHPTIEEIVEFRRFMGLRRVTIDDLVQFVKVYEPEAQFRDRDSVYTPTIGGKLAPGSGVQIKTRLLDVLTMANAKQNPFVVHLRYEHLHPFTDCNGRSGRMLWIWQMRNTERSFLHEWYYQSFEYWRTKL